MPRQHRRATTRARRGREAGQPIPVHLTREAEHPRARAAQEFPAARGARAANVRLVHPARIVLLPPDQGRRAARRARAVDLQRDEHPWDEHAAGEHWNC